MPSVHDEKAVKDFFGSIAGSNGVFVWTDAKDFVSVLGFFEDGDVEVNKVTEASVASASRHTQQSLRIQRHSVWISTFGPAR